MKVLMTDNLTGITEEIEVNESTQLPEPTNLQEPTLKQRIAEMEAEIARLKSELNVQQEGYA